MITKALGSLGAACGFQHLLCVIVERLLSLSYDDLAGEVSVLSYQLAPETVCSSVYCPELLFDVNHATIKHSKVEGPSDFLAQL